MASLFCYRNRVRSGDGEESVSILSPARYGAGAVIALRLFLLALRFLLLLDSILFLLRYFDFDCQCFALTVDRECEDIAGLVFGNAVFQLAAAGDFLVIDFRDDVILLKGVVSTHDIPRYTVCKNCGKTYVLNSIRNGDTGDLSNINSMVTYIVPIDFEIVHRCDTEKEAIHDVMQHVPISNDVQLVGRLCADPKTYENGKSTAYQLGIDRHFFIAEDDPDVAFDYPYIRSYGKQGISDMDSLKKGSLVLVDGALRLRWFNRRVTCPDCGTEKTLEDHVLEVVPNYVEYLADLKPISRTDKEPEL